MHVSLTPTLEKMIQEKVDSGLYNSASEVIREALRLLYEREQYQQRRIAELRREIQIGIDAVDRGEVVDGKTFMKELIEDLESRKK